MPTGPWKPPAPVGKVLLPQPIGVPMRKVIFAIMGLTLAAGSAQAAGIGARIGTTGLAADVAWDLAPTLSSRLGYSGGSVNHDVSTDLTTYHGKLNLKNLNTFLGFAPLGPFFRFTGGFIFNDNKFDVHTDQVSGGSLSGTVTPSKSAAPDPGTRRRAGGGAGGPSKRAAPCLGIGYGRVAGTGVNFYADLGVMYQGSPKASLTANCG